MTASDASVLDAIHVIRTVIQDDEKVLRVLRELMKVPGNQSWTKTVFKLHQTASYQIKDKEVKK